MCNSKNATIIVLIIDDDDSQISGATIIRWIEREREKTVFKFVTGTAATATTMATGAIVIQESNQIKYASSSEKWWKKNKHLQAQAHLLRRRQYIQLSFSS